MEILLNNELALKNNPAEAGMTRRSKLRGIQPKAIKVLIISIFLILNLLSAMIILYHLTFYMLLQYH